MEENKWILLRMSEANSPLKGGGGARYNMTGRGWHAKRLWVSTSTILFNLVKKSPITDLVYRFINERIWQTKSLHTVVCWVSIFSRSLLWEYIVYLRVLVCHKVKILLDTRYPESITHKLLHENVQDAAFHIHRIYRINTTGATLWGTNKTSI